MKKDIIAIGDIHGIDTWKGIVEANPDSKVIFIGDYFDSYDKISAAQQIYNFKEILELKKANKDRVELLTGNHDFHYLRTVHATYSGYQFHHASGIQDVIHSALDNDLMKVCHIEDDIIFSHAGVTNRWLKNTFEDGVPEDLEEGINELFKHKPNMFGFTPGKWNDPYGDEICQTPIWIRPRSLVQGRVDGYRQVVGHTQQDKLSIINGIAYIDTLGASKEYLRIIENGEMITCT